MTDNEFEKIKKRVLRVFGFFIKILELQDWDIKFNWYREGMPSNKKDDDSWFSVFSVLAYWEYRKAIIAVNVLSVNSIDDDELARACIHELLHIIISPLHINSEEECNCTLEKEEYTTTLLTKIVYDLILIIKKQAKKGKK